MMIGNDVETWGEGRLETMGWKGSDEDRAESRAR